MKIWYYAKSGQRSAPSSRDEIEKLFRSGFLGPKDLVWEQGTPAWVEAATIFEIAPPLPAQGGADHPQTGTETCGLAVTSLCLSILGLTCCCGVPILAIPGIILGHLSLSRIDSHPGLKGREMAIAGLVLGYLVLVLSLLSWIGISASKFHPRMGFHHLL